MSVNKVILVGNVGKDPETRHLENGVGVTSLTLATNNTYKGKDGEKKQDTEWHYLVFWRGLSDVVDKYVRKSDLIYVEGRLKSRSYEDKEGITKFVTEIIVDEMKMLGKKKEEHTQPQETTAQ